MDVKLPDGTIVTNIPEGTTQSQLRAKLEANGYKGFPEEKSGPIVQAGKDAFGGIEAIARMPWNVFGGTIAKGLRTTGELLTGSTLPEALERGDESGAAATIEPFTKSGAVADEMLGHGYEAVRGMAGDANAASDTRYSPTYSTETHDSFLLKNEAANRTLGEMGLDLVAFGGITKGLAGAGRAKVLQEAQMAEARAKMKAAEDAKIEARDRAIVEQRRREVAAAQAEGQGLRGELIQQRINEQAMRDEVPSPFRRQEQMEQLPEGTKLEVPEERPTDPNSRALGGRDMEPIAGSLDTPHRGLTEPNVQPDMAFQGRAEHPAGNLYENLSDAQGTPGNIQTRLAFAVEQVREQWKAVEKKMQEASDARLDKTTLRSVKNGPSGPTMEMLEQKKREISKMADELARRYKDYLSEGDLVSMNVIRRVHEMSTSPKIGGLDLAGRSDVIERTQSGREMGIGRQMPRGVGAKQGGAITLSASMSDVKNGPLVSAFREAFAHIKREYPRFSELTDIRLMDSKEWKRYVDGQFRTGHINREEHKQWMEAGGVATTGQHIRINAQHPGFGGGDVAIKVDTLVHELTHDWQDKRGRSAEWDKDSKLAELPWADRPWEKQAIQAGETAQTRIILDPRGKPKYGYVSEKYRTKGAIPLDSHLAGKPNIKSEYQSFKDDLKSKGLEFPEHITKALFKEEQAKSKTEGTYTPASSQEPTTLTTSKIPALKDLHDRYLNDWTPEQMTKAVVDYGKDILWGTKNTIKKATNPRFMLNHPLLKYVVSKGHEVKNTSRKMAEDVLMGDAYDSKGRRIPAPNSPMDLWSKFTDESKIIVNDVGQALTNGSIKATEAEIQAKARELHGRELTESELRSYWDRRKGMDRAWKNLNDYIKANPKPNGALRDELPYLPNYWSPAEFEGKFLTFVKDADGKVVAMEGTYLMPNLDKVAKAMGVPKERLSFIEKNTHNDLNPDALEASIRYLAEPKRKEVRAALTEALKSQGFSKHAKERSGVEGWAGSEGGKKGYENYERIYEEYIRQTYNHIGNRELDKLHGEILNNEKVREVAPRAHHFALEHIDQVRGRENATIRSFEQAVGQAMNTVRLPQSVVGDVFRKVNEVSVTYLIGFFKMSNIAANMLQAVSSAPVAMLKETAHLGLVGQSAAVSKAIAKSYKALAKPDAQSIKDIIGLRREGALEAQFKYDYEAYNSKGAGTPIQGAKTNPWEYLTGRSLLSWVESEMVRKPAGLMFVNILREMGHPEGKDLYRMASEMTDKYEATSKQHEAAHIFGRSGTVGRVMKPLQSFSTTWLGTYMEAVESMVKNPTSAAHAMPLVYALGVLYTLTGITGMPGVREWDWAMEKINKLTNNHFPTATEIIYSKIKSGAHRYGYLWDKLGITGGTTMSAPTLTGSVAPGAGLIGNAANAAATGVRNTGVFGEKNLPTEAEKREAIKGVVPSVLHGAIEKAYSDGTVVTNSKSDGSIIRGEADWNKRLWTGSFSTNEADQKARNWVRKQVQTGEAEQKSNVVELMVDQYVSTGKLNPKLIEEARKLNYTGKDLKEAMARELKRHTLPDDVRSVGKAKSFKQMRAEQLLRELQ